MPQSTAQKQVETKKDEAKHKETSKDQKSNSTFVFKKTEEPKAYETGDLLAYSKDIMSYTVKKMEENEGKMRALGIRDAGDLDIEHDGLTGEDEEARAAPQALHKEAVVQKKETKIEAPKQAKKQPKHQNLK